jgi:hypothetical protein
MSVVILVLGNSNVPASYPLSAQETIAMARQRAITGKM